MPADGAGQNPVRSTAAAVTVASSEFSNPRVLSNDILGGRSVYPADLDGDGDLDVLAASFRDTTVGWYENQWQQCVLRAARDRNKCPGRLVDAPRRILTVTAIWMCSRASYIDDTVAWYENQGGGAYSARRAPRDRRRRGRPPCMRRTSTGDGDLDVLSAVRVSTTRSGWYENQGGGTFSTRVAIAADADGAITVHGSGPRR